MHACFAILWHPSPLGKNRPENSGYGGLTCDRPGLLYRRNCVSRKNFAAFLFCVFAITHVASRTVCEAQTEVDRVVVGNVANTRWRGWGLWMSPRNLDVRNRIAHTPKSWENSMNRTVVSGIAAFALLIGASLMLTETTAEAARCGGGGLIAKIKAKRAAKCCAPEPVCCQPAPTCGGQRVGLLAKLKAKRAAKKCCAPEPTCCPAPCCPEPAPCCPEPAPCCPEPAPCCPEPAPCCPEPAPCCAPEPAPCCGGVVAAPAPCCGGGEVVQGAVVAGGDQGFDLAPGETLVPGSVQTVGGGEAAAASSSDAEMPAPAAEAPPAPTPDAKTDI